MFNGTPHILPIHIHLIPYFHIKKFNSLSIQIFFFLIFFKILFLSKTPLYLKYTGVFNPIIIIHYWNCTYIWRHSISDKFNANERETRCIYYVIYELPLKMYINYIIGYQYTCIIWLMTSQFLFCILNYAIIPYRLTEIWTTGIVLNFRQLLKK